MIATLGVVLVMIAFGMFAFQAGPNSVDDTGALSQLMVAFMTGITTGGLSCLAVQGGLLASSLAHQIEQDFAGQVKLGKKSAKATKKDFIPDY